MDNNKNTLTEGIQTSTEGTQERTFTQDDVNRIVQDRLAKEKNKSNEELQRKEQELAEREKELTRKEFTLNAKRELAERGFSEDMLEALNTTSEEAFKKSLDTIDKLLESRKLSEKDSAQVDNKAVFTSPMNVNNRGYDPIRRAMKLE